MEENLSSDYSSKISIKTKNISEDNKLLSISNIIAELLKDICDSGKTNSDSNVLLIKPFISKKIPGITIKDYMNRLLKYSKAFNGIFIIILIYLDTICTKHTINLNYNNIHKFILAAFIAAIKFHEDEYYSISYYAKLGGITQKELINLEYEFLSLIDFKLYINQELYDKYYDNLSNLNSLEEEDESDNEFD